MIVRRGLLVLAACLLGVASPFAQTTRGDLQGTVLDGAGLALNGVVVTAHSAALPVARSTTTDARGRYRFVLLPPGEYRVVFDHGGHEHREHDSVRINTGATLRLDVTLLATVTDEVVITTESPVVDTRSAALGASLDERILAVLPSSRDPGEVPYLAPGVVNGRGIARDEIDSAATIFGAPAGETLYLVDSLDTTDVVDGGWGTSTSMNFLEEVQVRSAGHEASFGGVLGAVVNVVTRSGGNEFHGDVFGSVSRAALWRAATVPPTRGESRAWGEDYDVGLTLGGKLVEDRLWYFVAVNPRRLEHRVVNEIRTAEGDLVGISRGNRSVRRDHFAAKLSWRAGNANSLTLSVLGDPTRISDDPLATNTLESALVGDTNLLVDRELGGLDFGLDASSVLGERLFLETTLGQHAAEETITPQLVAPTFHDLTRDGRWTVGSAENAWLGGAGILGSRDGSSRDQLRGSLTWFAGERHELELGASLSRTRYRLDQASEPGATWLCAPSSRENPWFGGQGAFRFDPSSGEHVALAPDCDSNGDGALDGVRVAAGPASRLALHDGYYTDSRLGLRSRGEARDLGLYLQDSFRVSDFVTLNLGVRAHYSNSEGDGSQSPGASPGQPRRIRFSLDDMLAPRLGMVWDFARNGRSKLFVTYGRFYQPAPLALALRAFSDESRSLAFFSYPDQGGLPGQANPGELIELAAVGPAVVAPGLDPAHLDEVVLGARYEVTTGLAVGLTYIRRQLGQAIEDVSLDGGYTWVITNPGGTYAVNPATGADLAVPVGVPRARRDFEGFELSLSKRWANRWQADASLLWSRLQGNVDGMYSRDGQGPELPAYTGFDLPELVGNGYGFLDSDREWQLKAWGSYSFDFGLSAGISAFYLTGTPVSKLGAHRLLGLDQRFITPRGSEGRTEDWANVDLRLSCPVRVGRLRVEALLDLFNVFDEQAPVEADQRWTVYGPGDEASAPGGDVDAASNPHWGEPLVYSPPRRLRLGFKVSW